MCASYNGSKDIVELLLKNGANVEERDKEGKTALMLAIENGNKEIVDILLKNKLK